MIKEFTRAERNDIAQKTPCGWNGKSLADLFDYADTIKAGRYQKQSSSASDTIWDVYWKGIWTRVITGQDGKIISHQKPLNRSYSKVFKSAVKAYVDNWESNLAVPDMYEKFKAEVYSHEKEKKEPFWLALDRWILNTTPDVSDHEQKAVLAMFYGVSADDARIRKMDWQTTEKRFSYYIREEIIRRHDARL